jgi:ferredoxin
MALFINEDCINCGACEPVCPNNAIYEGGDSWRFSDKTNLSGDITTLSGVAYDGDAEQETLSEDLYFIVPDKCTECKGFHEEPQCIAECPVDCIFVDENHTESEETLLEKKTWMHG